MKRFFWLLFFLLICQSSWAETYKVVSLYSDGALVTSRFLPFKIYSSKDVAQSIQVISLTGPCRTLMDPSRSQVFHLYCLEAGAADLRVKLRNGDVVAFGPLDIRKVSIIKTDYDDDFGQSLGEQLFKANCVECHATQPIKGPVTAEMVVTNLGKNPMKSRGLDSLIGSDSEKVDAIVQYINGGK